MNLLPLIMSLIGGGIFLWYTGSLSLRAWRHQFPDRVGAITNAVAACAILLAGRVILNWSLLPGIIWFVGLLLFAWGLGLVISQWSALPWLESGRLPLSRATSIGLELLVSIFLLAIGIGAIL